jgi:hypothetical protein
MGLTPEAFIAIAGVIVALPPVLLIMWKIAYRRQYRDEESHHQRQQFSRPAHNPEQNAGHGDAMAVQMVRIEQSPQHGR